MIAENLTGKKFGRLCAIKRVENRGRRTMWLWQCECGEKTRVAADQVKSGHTTSCGCVWTEKCRKHGHGHDKNGQQSRTYKAWVNMRSRADGVTPSYKRNYTDRGIVVCERWRSSFEAFLADMGEAPAGKSLDRFPDNDGDYKPSNCRWATRTEQSRNTRKNLHVIVAGQKVCLKEACDILGLNYATVGWRVQSGRTPQQAVEMGVAR